MLYLHSHRPVILHRDLKSPNLLVSKEWRVQGALEENGWGSLPGALQKPWRGACSLRRSPPGAVAACRLQAVSSSINRTPHPQWATSTSAAT